MLILRSPEVASRIGDAEIRRLVEQRFIQICNGEAYDHDLHGYMIVVEPGDSVSALEEESGCPILRNLFDDARFGDPEFTPSAEAVEEHSNCYEIVFILNDDGFGIEIFVPKADGVDPELLTMCATFAVPTAEVSSK